MTRRCSPAASPTRLRPTAMSRFVTLSRFATEGNDLAMVNDEGKRMLELDDNEKAIFQKIKDSGKFKKNRRPAELRLCDGDGLAGRVQC